MSSLSSAYSYINMTPWKRNIPGGEAMIAREGGEGTKEGANICQTMSERMRAPQSLTNLRSPDPFTFTDLFHRNA